MDLMRVCAGWAGFVWATEKLQYVQLYVGKMQLRLIDLLYLFR